MLQSLCNLLQDQYLSRFSVIGATGYPLEPSTPTEGQPPFASQRRSSSTAHAAHGSTGATPDLVHQAPSSGCRSAPRGARTRRRRVASDHEARKTRKGRSMGGTERREELRHISKHLMMSTGMPGWHRLASMGSEKK